MAEVILLCGKTSANKEAYAKHLSSENQAVILSCDDMMFMLYEDRMAMKHNPVLRKCKVYLVHLAEEIIASGTSVILDLDLWSVHERKVIKQYFESKGMKTQLHYIKSPEEEWNEEKEQKDIENRHSTYFVDKIVENLFNEDFEEPAEDEVDVLFIKDPYEQHKTK